MNCIITKLPTKNKWRGHVIHPYALAKAKIMIVEKGNANLTMRKCLMHLQKEFQMILAKEKEVSNEKYCELLEKFLGGDE